MKVLFFFTVNKSFLSDYFVALAEHVAGQGHDVVVFSWKSISEKRNNKNVTYITSTKKGRFQQYYCIYSLIKSEQPTTIISNFSYVNPALVAAKFFKKINSIAWQHSLIAQTKASQRQIFIKRNVLRLADTIVVNSTHLKKELANQFSLKKKNIALLPFWSTITSYSEKKIKLPTADFLIGCCGRLEADKNQRTLLEAFAIIKNNLPNTSMKLILAGEGADAKFLKEKAASLAIKDHVVFLGLLSAQEMVAFYNAMQLIVLPSLHEAFGLTFIEALALDRPVLVSDAFGALTFINNRSDALEKIVFKPDDAKMLAAKMKSFILQNEISIMIPYKSLYDTIVSKESIQKQFDNILEKTTTLTNVI